MKKPMRALEKVWAKWRSTGGERTLGRSLLLLARANLILALAGLVATPLLLSRLGLALDAGLDMAGDAAVALSGAILDSSYSLDQASAVLTVSSDALRATQGSLAETEPLLGSLTLLMGEDLPATIEDTRASLISAQAGAKAIDQVLRGLSTFGLLTGVHYDPEEPLDVAMAHAADGLQDLPATLRSTSQGLEESHESLAELMPHLSGMSDELGSMADELASLAARTRDLAATASGIPGALRTVRPVLSRATWMLGVVMEWGWISFAALQWPLLNLGRKYASGSTP